MLLSAYYWLVIKLRQVELPIFKQGQSLRILHLSDLHLTPKQKNKIADLKELADLDPDLTIITGDFFGDVCDEWIFDFTQSTLFSIGITP